MIMTFLEFMVGPLSVACGAGRLRSVWQRAKLKCMGSATKTLYDTDFAEWSAQTAALLRARRFDQLDIDNIAEEIESLGKSNRLAVQSQMRRLLLHQIKRRIQPKKETASWRRSILDSQHRITALLSDSPSLARFLESDLDDIYRGAVRGALIETGLPEALPDRCPFTVGQLLRDFDLAWPD